jgi:hypothetical protein
MSLPNPVVYIQFHPVTYMVKLNIEMSMASLIIRLAHTNASNDFNAYIQPSTNTAQSQFDAELGRISSLPPAQTSDRGEHRPHDQPFRPIAKRGRRPSHSGLSGAHYGVGFENISRGGAYPERAIELGAPVETSSISSGPDEVGKVFGMADDRSPLTATSTISVPAPSKRATTHFIEDQNNS